MRQKAVWSFVFLMLAWSFYFSALLQDIFFNTEAFWVTLCNWGIVAASLSLVFIKRQKFRHNLVVSSQAGIFILFLLEGGYIAGTILTSPMIQIVSIILMVPALVLAVFGPFVCQTIFSALFYFLLIIPLQLNQTLNVMLFVSIAIVLFLLLFSQRSIRYSLNVEPPLWTYQNARWLVPTAIIFGFFMTGPWLGDNIRHFYPETDRLIVLRAPLGTEDWIGPRFVKQKTWDPSFPGASATLVVEYLSQKEETNNNVYLYTAYFGPDKGTTELFDKHNVLYDQNSWHEISTKTQEIMLQKGGKTKVLEKVLNASNKARVIWYWYYVAGVVTNDAVMAAILDKMRLISGEAQGSGVIVLSSPYLNSPDEARLQLSSFLKEMYSFLEVLKTPEIHFEKRTQFGKY